MKPGGAPNIDAHMKGFQNMPKEDAIEDGTGPGKDDVSVEDVGALTDDESTTDVAAGTEETDKLGICIAAHTGGWRPGSAGGGTGCGTVTGGGGGGGRRGRCTSTGTGGVADAGAEVVRATSLVGCGVGDRRRTFSTRSLCLEEAAGGDLPLADDASFADGCFAGGCLSGMTEKHSTKCSKFKKSKIKHNQKTNNSGN